MTIPRGFTRCDECGGAGTKGTMHCNGPRDCIGTPEGCDHCGISPCPSCSGSGLRPTEKLREEIAQVLADLREFTFQIRADAVLRKVAEHIREDR